MLQDKGQIGPWFHARGQGDMSLQQLTLNDPDSVKYNEIMNDRLID